MNIKDPEFELLMSNNYEFFKERKTTKQIIMTNLVACNQSIDQMVALFNDK